MKDKKSFLRPGLIIRLLLALIILVIGFIYLRSFFVKGQDTNKSKELSENFEDFSDENLEEEGPLKEEDKSNDRFKDEKSTDDSSEELDLDSIGFISHSEVMVHVNDVCIVPRTLVFMAANKEWDVVKTGDDSITLELESDDDLIALYDELSKMGEVKEEGSELLEDRIVNIRIINE